jgi:NADH:ubiquinone oxidoreductase subunit 2 (subunit N)
MWMEEPTSTNELVVARPVQVVIGVSVAATLIVGIFPDMLLNAAELVRFAPR